jgi:hypothetical protein
MLFGQENKAVYFSVTYTASIGMMRCVPQVCYKMSEDIRATVEDMEEKGLARIFQEEMRFISGVPMPIKKPGDKTEALSSVSSEESLNEPVLAKHGRKNRIRGNREFD